MNIITFVHKLSTGIENLLIAVHPLFQQRAQYLKIPTLHFV